MPDAVARLYKTANDPDSCISDFEAIIRTDASLTVNLLRMANSPFFGLSKKVDDLGFAIMLLGSKRVLEAATGSSLISLIPRWFPGYEIDAKVFWIHSVTVAALTVELSKQIGNKPPNLAFIAGLLHDVGKIAIGSFLALETGKGKSVVVKNPLTSLSIEHAELGTDHARVGASLVSRWDLPPVFAWSTQWHHTPGAAPPGSDRVLIDTIHAANALAGFMGQEATPEQLYQAVDKDASARLHLTADHIDLAMRRAALTVRDLEGLVGVDEEGEAKSASPQ
jgi:putative nucleotidyltransferase with HDIG domain